MVKTYLRYVPGATFGVVTSGSIAWDSTGHKLITAQLESIGIWIHRSGSLDSRLVDAEHNQEVTQIAASPDKTSVAAGYSDGSIKIWDIAKGTCKVTFNGHRSSVSCLKFNKNGSLLASGSQDTSVIIWDVVAETGLFKLKGHKDVVTDLTFFEKGNKLITSSKDSFVKIWDLDTQHCVQTIVLHRNEIWSLDINKQETRLITGSVDDKIRIWSLDKEEFSKLNDETDETETQVEEVHAKYFGYVERESKERVSSIRFNSKGTHFACQSADNMIQFFELRSPEEIQKKLRKRKQKEKKRLQEEGVTDPKVDIYLTASDEYHTKQILRTSKKIKSFAFSPNDSQIAISLVNNQIEVYDLTQPEDNSFSKVSTVAMGGHRSDVRDAALSSDDSLLLTTSSNEIKVWNTRTYQCIRTIESGYGLCGAFVPGNRHVIIGTKTGELEIYELASSSLVESIKAHEGAIWSLDIRPDKTGLVTGSADKTVKFWEFELKSDDPKKQQTKQLTLSQTKNMTLTDDVLSVKFSPDGKIVAVSSLDNTVKIFYEDTLKFYLSLYGHKLPVMSMSISSDSTLIATASADKNVKIWGLDFGDCHKSLFAHDDGIMQVRFVNNTHYFWTCSKDKSVKYWDGDKFELIQVLNGHQSPVWGLAVSSSGDFVVSTSQDRSIRFWNRTDEQLFLEEERERMMEKLFEEEDARKDQRTGTEGETSMATKRTLDTIKSSERLIEALDITTKYEQSLEEWRRDEQEAQDTLTAAQLKERKEKGAPALIDPPAPSLLMMGLTPSQYILKVVKDIRSSDLEEALLILPLGHITHLLQYINIWIEQGSHIELACRCLFFLLKMNHTQLASDTNLMKTLDSLKENTRKKLQEAKDLIGFNRSAMRFLKRGIEMNTSAFFFEDSLSESRKKQKSTSKLF